MRTRTAFASNATCRTQMHLARQGTVTPEMQRVGEREELSPELVRGPLDHDLYVARPGSLRELAERLSYVTPKEHLGLPNARTSSRG